MPKAVKGRPEGRLAKALTERMNELDLTIRQVAAKTGMSYEHIRKLVKGATHPSRLALHEVCRVLGLNLKAITNLAVADRIEKKYGGIPHELQGDHPELSLLSPWWDLLSEEQKASFQIQMKSVAESNEVSSVRKPVRGTKGAPTQVRRAARR
jgi:transcriptional regulator with XRE-family HTH domain